MVLYFSFAEKEGKALEVRLKIIYNRTQQNAVSNWFFFFFFLGKLNRKHEFQYMLLLGLA